MKPFIHLFFFLFATFVSAQKPYMRHFGVDEGLPCSKIYTVMQDSKGYLWICTEQGIARFDGYHFETFGTHTGLPYSDFWGAKEDSKGRIWFATFNTHFVHYDYKDRKFHIKKNQHKINGKGGTGNYMVEDENGGIWYYSQFIGYNVDKDTFIDYSDSTNRCCAANLPYSFAREFIYDKISLYNNQYFTGYEGKKNLTDTKTTFRDSMIWQPIAGDAWVFINEHTYLAYSSHEKKLYYRSPALKKESLMSQLSPFPISERQSYLIIPINENEIFINTHLECFVIDSNLTRLRQFDFLRDYAINSIHKDKEGNYWICTKNEGLYLLSANAAQSHTFEMQKDKDIRAITADKTGRVWIGTSKGQVFYTEGDTLKELFFQKPNHLNIRDLVVTEANTLIIAFEAYNIFYPLSFLSQNSKKVEMNWADYASEFECNIDICKTACFPKDKNKIMVTDDTYMRNFYRKKNRRILFVPNGGKFSELYDKIERQEYTNYATHRRTTACAEAKFNPENAWLGTTIGLFFYCKETLITDSLSLLKEKYPILNQSILDMETDNNGDTWVATDGAGLYRVQEKITKTLININLFEVPALKGKTIKSIFIDTRNHLWAATNEGAWEFIISENNMSEVRGVRRYSIAQGLPTNEVNGIYADDKHVFIATSKGLTRIQLQNYSALSKVPSFLDVQIKVNKKDSILTFPIKFSYKENMLRFEFVCLSFKSDKNIRYHFRLRRNGADAAWQNTTERYLDFPFLPEGDYTFEVKAENIDGEMTNVHSIIFEILPPWWRTTWFMGLCFVIFLGLVYLVFRWQTRDFRHKSFLRLRASHANEMLQRERVEALEKAAEYHKQVANLEAKTLLSQMNPHFLFNVLTSIQRFVLKNEPAISADYLTRFAKLIRIFLEASREKYIPIEKEYAMLKNYIELEQLRFKGLFQFEISIAENTDTNMEIPPMFIQPFVENAINHGLMYKGENGHLTVSFCNEDENTLLCVVEDDGVGREKARELQAKSLRGHKSLALKIIQDRIVILQEVENWKIDLTFIDKKDEAGNGTGTRVELRLHFE